MKVEVVLPVFLMIQVMSCMSCTVSFVTNGFVTNGLVTKGLVTNGLVSPPGMVETPRLQAKRSSSTSPKGTRLPRLKSGG